LIRKASVRPVVRVRWISWPEPLMIVLSSGWTGFRKVSESSAVVNRVAGGRSVWREAPSGASESIASIPPGMSPVVFANQGEAGIEKPA
jgi:hypothetical protein